MTSAQENAPVEQKAQSSDKELNFRKLEERYEKALQEERQKRLEIETTLHNRTKNSEEEEDDYSEPYIDHRKLKKELNQFATRSKQDTQSEIQKAVKEAIYQERQNNWIKEHPDFEEVMSYAELFANKDPEWAKDYMDLETGNFEKQKLVYKSIKSMGLHKKEEPKPSIQDEIKNNRKSNYYNPSGIGSAPYQGYVPGKEYSESEQKNAYGKMQELKNRLRIG